MSAGRGNFVVGNGRMAGPIMLKNQRYTFHKIQIKSKLPTQTAKVCGGRGGMQTSSSSWTAWQLEMDMQTVPVPQLVQPQPLQEVHLVVDGGEEVKITVPGQQTIDDVKALMSFMVGKKTEEIALCDPEGDE